MGSWTITTTTAEDEAIDYAYKQSQKPISPVSPPPPVETIEQFFQRQVQFGTIDPISEKYKVVQNQDLIATFSTVPPENRSAAKEDIENVVVQHGGSVTLDKVDYLWSTSTAPPPRNNSIEVDVNQANFSTVTKIFFDYVDANNKDQMSNLLKLPVNTLISIEDKANNANFLSVVTTGIPIQRQGADGHVEIPVKFSQGGGTLADTVPVLTEFV